MAESLEFALPMLYPDSCEALAKRRDFSRRMLLRALDGGKTVALVGSGVSKDFGYPGWKDFALELLKTTQEALADKEGIPVPPAVQDEIRDFRQGARRAKNRLSANELMFLIGTCRSVLRQYERSKVYEEFIEQKFAPPSRTRKLDPDPCELLLKLPIHRFVTTNYDCELERALVCHRSACSRDLGVDLKQKEDTSFGRSSFTQMEGSERLVRFALASDEELEVFHCHGRYDRLDSIVATEEDYQHWYLGQTEGGPLVFQQNLELLLGSNPVLFVGYGLGDEDLLRPLRLLRVLDPSRKQSRPLFALLPSKDPEGTDSYYHASLLERFGLHVLAFPCQGPKTQRVDLCSELKRISCCLETERRIRNEKPKMRSTCSVQPLPAPHYEIVSAEVPAPPLRELESAIREPGVVVLIGPSGCGKSHRLLEIMNSSQDECYRFEGAFYWNAQYANEAFTALETALSYFDPKTELQGNWYDRLTQCFLNHRFLLVVDGCERLLYPSDTVGEGTPYSSTFERLLGLAMKPESRSTVVLATRLLPAELKGSRGGSVRIVQATRVEAGDLAREKPFKDILEEEPDKDLSKDLSSLCSLLRGHAYGLRLAGEYLLDCCPPRSKALADLVCQLADKPRDERLHAMVLLLVQRLDSTDCEDHGPGLVRAFLERLALFLSPVSRRTLQLCFEQAHGVFPDDKRSCDDVYDRLQKSGLLVPFWDLKLSQTVLTVHGTVRTALFQTRQGGASAALPAFGLSGFTCGRQGVDPDLSYCRQVKAIFDAVINEANTEPQSDLSRELCRDAYNLIRTRMEANTAPRWHTYDGYLQFGLRLAFLVKRTIPDKTWTYCEYPDAKRFTEDKAAPLYPAEMAWLYNDIALALSARGAVNDACFFWEQAYEISRLLEDPRLPRLHENPKKNVGGSYHLEVLLSLAFTSIERGRLRVGSQYLDDAKRLLQDQNDEDYTARIAGLKGLIAHLQGNLQKAADLYESALMILRFGDNLRAQSVFLKHLADVKISMQQLDEADMLIRNSRALAESGVFPELVANARISEGHRLSRTGEPVKARLEYNAVLSEARQIGCRKLEVRVLTALSRLALDQKDVGRAHELAMEALCLSNELGLGLRQSHCLVVLGLVALEADKKELGIAYLELAWRTANDQEYWARSREAENKLRELGVDPKEPARGAIMNSSYRPPAPPPAL
ncbi:MAG TPA: SIR2 family protein [Thermoanaerobaculia bacterium]